MSIVGGITPCMGYLIDSGTLSALVGSFSAEEAAIRSAFYLPIVCFAIVFAYALAFRNAHEIVPRSE